MQLKNKKILITGGAGFIGSHLAKELAIHNKVWIVGRNKPAISNGIFVKADITKKSFLEFLRKNKFDYFFHLAGNADLHVAFKNPQLDFETNAVATFSILETLRKLSQKPKFIFASSVAVYGEQKDRRLNEDTSITRPVSNYGVSKLIAERYVSAFARQYGVPCVTVRIFSTYGPGLRRQIVYDFIIKLSRNPHKLQILGDGTQARDMVFVDDQVRNIIRVAERAEYGGEVYNLCSGKLSTTKDIARYVAKAMHLRPRFVFTKKARVFDGQTWLGNNTKIKSMGCRTEVTMQKGIEKTVRWYQDTLQKEN